MCGIAGYKSNTTRLSQQSIDSMIGSLAHRGPDARGLYTEENLTLVHLRLSILDLSSSANQPMLSHCGRYMMVYNGEVYNFREIEQDILKANPSFKANTTSDSEIILEAFALWHTRFVEKLNGMFGIAIWDKSEKQLFLFRDRIGIKPIYYYQKDGVFAFSSELKALTSCSEIRKNLNIDPVAINQFLHLGYIPHPNSIFSEIRKFPAGHWAVIDQQNQIRLTCYWNLEEKACATKHHYSDTQALEELRELVQSAVQYRLVSDVPYGTFLSGGIDSSLVTAVASKVSSDPLNTFSIGFWEKDFNEAPFARKIAEYLGTSHHEFIVSEQDALDWIPKLNAIYDEPFADSSAIPTLMVSQMARKNVTMTLSGDGGDELFLGYGAYLWAERLSSPAMQLLRYPAAWLLHLGSNRHKRAAGLFEYPVEKDFLKSHIFSQEQYLFSRKEIQNILHNHDPFHLQENLVCNTLTPAEQQSVFDMLYYLPDDLLVKVDRASMHFALETRVPLLDYRLIEWSLKTQQHLKIRNGKSKWLLKELLNQYIPRELFERPKKGFAIPLNTWLKKELRDYAMDYLNNQAIQSTNILDKNKVAQILDLYYKKGQTHQYNKIWLLLVLQKWINEFRINT